MNKPGLVLSGGGSRGSYQIGAYRALKDNGIEILSLIHILTEPVSNVLPHAHLTTDLPYSGWIPFFIEFTSFRSRIYIY